MRTSKAIWGVTLVGALAIRDDFGERAGGLRRRRRRETAGRAQGAERHLLRRRRHGRVDGHGGARLLRGRRRSAGGGPVPLHCAVAHLFRGFDHPGQRSDDVGDDDRRQYQSERDWFRRRAPSPTTSTTMATARLVDAAGAGQGARHEGRRRLDRADHARDAGRHLLAHQSAQQRERHRAAGAADRRHLQPSPRRRHRRPDGRRSSLLRARRPSSTRKVGPAAAPTTAICATSSWRPATNTCGTAPVSTRSRPTTVRSSVSSSAATWSMNSTARPISAASRALPR